MNKLTNMKLLKYPLTLISPVLAYFAYIGNVGASNLLVGWTLFGLFLALIFSVFIALIILFGHLVPKDENFGKKLNEVKPDFEKISGFTFATVIDILCFVFYVWCGWWGLAAMEVVQVATLKFSIYLFLAKEFNNETTV